MYEGYRDQRAIWQKIVVILPACMEYGADDKIYGDTCFYGKLSRNNDNLVIIISALHM